MLTKVSNYSISVGCIFGGGQNQCLQLKREVNTASKIVAVFLGGGLIKVVSKASSADNCLLLDRKLKTASNCSISAGCISRWRQDPVMSNVSIAHNCL